MSDRPEAQALGEASEYFCNPPSHLPNSARDHATALAEELAWLLKERIRCTDAFAPVLDWYDGDGQRDDFPAMLAAAVADLQSDRGNVLRLNKAAVFVKKILDSKNKVIEAQDSLAQIQQQNISELQMIVDTNGMYHHAAKEHIKTLEAKLAKVQNGLVDLMEDQDAILPELRTLYDILTAPNRIPQEPTHDPN